MQNDVPSGHSDHDSTNSNDAASGSQASPTESGRLSPTIPDHEMLRCIGEGSYGEVWLARAADGSAADSSARRLSISEPNCLRPASLSLGMPYSPNYRSTRNQHGRWSAGLRYSG